MSKKDKQRYLNILNNKNKCCANCSQLEKDNTGNYLCAFLNSWNETVYASVKIYPNRIFHQGKMCFDKYNGKNVETNQMETLCKLYCNSNFYTCVCNVIFEWCTFTFYVVSFGKNRDCYIACSFAQRSSRLFG